MSVKFEKPLSRNIMQYALAQLYSQYPVTTLIKATGAYFKLMKNVKI